MTEYRQQEEEERKEEEEVMETLANRMMDYLNTKEHRELFRRAPDCLVGLLLGFV